MSRCVCLLLCLLVIGCGRKQNDVNSAVDAAAAEDDAEIPEIVPMEFVSADGGTEVEVLSVDCAITTTEACNAQDEDCDGKIDEGCGYGTGHMQITMSWDTGSDLDLYVTDPVGETLSFQRPSTPGGGRVDQSGRGDCSDSDANSRIENVRWVRDRPPSGTYRIAAHYWGECVRGGGPTTLTLSIAVAEKTVASFRYSLLPGERTTIAKFSVK